MNAQPAITHDPLVLDPTVRILGILDAKLKEIRGKLSTTDDAALIESVTDCLDIVAAALTEEVQRNNANMVAIEL